MDLQDLHNGLGEVLAQHSRGRQPQLAGPLVELTGGWASTAVYACDLIDADAEGSSSTRAVLKVYADDDAGVQHALKERQALAFLGTTAIRAPTVLLSDAGLNPLGRPYLLMDHLKGVPFWAAYEQAPGAEARAALVRAFVHPLVSLHSLDPGPLEPAADRMSGYGFIDVELAGLHRDVAALPASGLAEVINWLQARRTGVPCVRPVVLHRDYHPWNVVRSDDGAVGVLDWDWQIGDARFDLAWTCTLMQRSGQDAFSGAVAEEYARQSGTALERLDYFEVLTTARWLLNVLPALCADSRLGPANGRTSARSWWIRCGGLKCSFRSERASLLPSPTDVVSIGAEPPGRGSANENACVVATNGPRVPESARSTVALRAAWRPGLDPAQVLWMPGRRLGFFL